MSSPRHKLPNRVVGTLLNRADLLLAFAHLPAESRAAAADDCGFRPMPPREEEKPAPAARPAPARPAEPRRQPKPPSPPELRFLQAVTYKRIEVEEIELPPEIGKRPISEGELDARPYRIKPELLQPWSRLWPYLHCVLGQYLPGRRIDLPRLVDDMARLRPVQRLPFRRRLAWAPQFLILVDGASPMDQFRGDIDALLARLRKLRGSEGFQCRLLTAAPDSDEIDKISTNISPGRCPWTAPRPEDTVLVLSDLGCLDQDPMRRGAWLRYGLQLQRNGVLRFALSPCPRNRWDAALARVWACAPWDRHERLPHGKSGFRPASAVVDEGQRQRMLEALLRACSVAQLVESPLLRDLRMRLPEADVGLEHDLRTHPEISAMAGVCALNFQHVDGRMHELISEADELTTHLKNALPELLRKHHAVHSALLRASETYNLHAAGLEVTEEELAEARSVFRAGNRSRWEEIESATEPQAVTDRRGLAAWNVREAGRRSRARFASDSELAAACALEALAAGCRAEPPDGIDLKAYRRTRYWGLREHHAHRTWQLRQNGQALELQRPSAPPPTGNPLALLPSQAPSLSLVLREKTGRRVVDLRTDREDGRCCPMASPRRISIASDSCELEVVAREVPPWATRFGWDWFGLFADFEVGGVTFALRWIPPGEFVMGSPEDEPGRWNEEGPQHQVTIGRGFWMGQTAVTQEQYAAVSGDRPSYFRHAGDQAPVEQVSWNDCEEFCRKLALKVTHMHAGWAFRLPTEAEWEYACRAGTTTALYTGPLTIKGENNGPEMDPIAWYGGNSRVDYEGAIDASNWSEKQYDFTRAGTHPVGQKDANHWGLYDMLGNVWEWCEDQWHDGYDGAPDDGRAWCDQHSRGGRRVCRGGCWYGVARSCRCACRYDGGPGGRNDRLGFRLVLAAKVNGDIRSFS